MKSLFVSKEETVTVDVYSFINEEKGEMYISENKDVLLKKSSATEEQIVKNSVVFRVPTYGDNKAIYEDSVRIENGEVHMDPFKLRHNKFVLLVKDWDFKDETGEPLSVSVDNVNNMSPALADLILDELEKIIGVG